MSKGTKYDQDKADLSLIPYSAQEAEARVFGFGAKKYGRDNYKAGMESHRLIAACMRHIGAYNQGENLDAESGLSHLAHARCCLSMLIELDRIGELTDTRYRAQELKDTRYKPANASVGHATITPVDGTGPTETITYSNNMSYDKRFEDRVWAEPAKTVYGPVGVREGK